LIGGLFIAGNNAFGETAAVVSILMSGSYFSEPANVRFAVAVEPNEENRFLWVEADSGDVYRASEMTLDGTKEKRLHAFVFKSLPGGHYTLRASVRSQLAVRGLVTRSIVIIGKKPAAETGSPSAT
jgi:hypothetical protein